MKRRMFILLLTSIMFTNGCALGKGNITQDTIIVNKKGTVSGVIVQDFSKDQYNQEELSKMIQEEIAAYDSSSEKVKLNKFEVTEDNKVYADISYATDEDYKAFNDMDFFCGTVSDAYGAGYAFADMQSVNSGESGLDAKSVLEKSTMNVVVFSEATAVKVPGKIAYVSEGVSIIGKKEARTESEGTFYIIYE